jgi:NAD-dependent SIR2 family protein deacetylase
MSIVWTLRKALARGLSSRLASAFGTIESARGSLPVSRPLLCRLGFHRWTFWDVMPDNYRRLVSKCRRCGARREMVFKGTASGPSEEQGSAAELIAAQLRRDLCQERSSERESKK